MKIKNIDTELQRKRRKSQLDQEQKYLPRILVPEFSAYLAVYGPPIYNINKIQLLPPLGPISNYKYGTPALKNNIANLDNDEPFPNSLRNSTFSSSHPRRDSAPMSDDVPSGLIEIFKGNDADNNFEILRNNGTMNFFFGNVSSFLVGRPKNQVRRVVPTEGEPVVKPSWTRSAAPQPPWFPPQTPALVTNIQKPKPIRVKPKPFTTVAPTRKPEPVQPAARLSSSSSSFLSDPLWATKPQAFSLGLPNNVNKQLTTNRKPSNKKNKKAKAKSDPLMADRCSPDVCRLPKCRCGGSNIPGDLKVQDIPQLVMITFDDSVNDLNWDIYKEIFTDRYNPNGCPILGTFYVSHEWTDYSQVQTLYSAGHEMASHTITLVERFGFD